MAAQKTKKSDKTASTKTQEIQQKIYADKCSLRKGIYTAKWLYFYTHGASIEKYVHNIVTVFPNATIVDSSNNWNAWPKDSWFEVQFKLN